MKYDSCNRMSRKKVYISIYQQKRGGLPMKKTWKQKLFPLLLIATMLLTQTIVSAENLKTQDNEPLPSKYQTIIQISAALKITGNTAKCVGEVILKSGYSGTLTVTLQRKNGNSWVYVNSWTGNVPTGGIKRVVGTQSLSIHGTYRVKVSFVSSSENETLYSQTAVY